MLLNVLLCAAMVVVAAVFTPMQTLVLWAAFVVGELLNVLKQAAMAIRNPHNPVSSRRDYVYRNWDIIALRGAGGVLFFWAYKTWPDGLTQLLGHFGVQLNLNLPLIPVVAFGLGLVSDFFLDWIAVKIPVLQKELPHVDVPPPPAFDEKSKDATAGK